MFPGLQGGPHNHTTAGIAVALHEAAQPSFRGYAAQVVANAKALAEALLAKGYDLVSGGTDNHLLLVDLTSKGIAGKPAAKALDRAGMELNFNSVPFDPRRRSTRQHSPGTRRSPPGPDRGAHAAAGGLDGRGDRGRDQGRRRDLDRVEAEVRACWLTRSRGVPGLAAEMSRGGGIAGARRRRGIAP